MLLLKLALVPSIILLVSIVSRYWGAFVGGLLSGLPVIAAPITLLLALEYGHEFAIQSAHSTLLGVIALSTFCFVYAWGAAKYNWKISLFISWGVYFSIALIVSKVSINSIYSCVAALSILFLLRSNLPELDLNDDGARISRKEIIARMVASAILVMLVTGLATSLGPNLSGVFAAFPVAATVLAVFTHKYYGARQVATLLKGLMLGTFSLVFFYFSLISLSSNFSFYLSFIISLTVVVIIQLVRVLLTNAVKS